MDVRSVFLTAYAKDWAGVSDWWSRALGRRWDREPVSNCHEWSLMGGVIFQVIDFGGGPKGTVVTVKVDDLDVEVGRLRGLGFAAPDPAKVPGFATLRFCSLKDPEGNELGLLDGD